MNAHARKPRTAELSAEQDPRWAAVVAGDRAADGKFYYSVETTGIYCRPSCPARHAKAINVRLHMTRGDAERAGFRPCKRCKPDQAALDEQHAAKVANICRMIEAADEMPTLASLARAASLSVHHFHRIFKAVSGLTPRDYAAAHRTKRVQNELKRSNTVTEAIYAA